MFSKRRGGGVWSGNRLRTVGSFRRRRRRSFLQPCEAAQELMLHASKSRGEKRVARIGAVSPESRNRQFGELSSFDYVSGVTFVINRQLFACVSAIVRIGSNFQPNRGGVRVLAAALGRHRELAARFGADFRWQSNRQGFCACRVRAIVFSTPLEKSR